MPIPLNPMLGTVTALFLLAGCLEDAAPADVVPKPPGAPTPMPSHANSESLILRPLFSVSAAGFSYGDMENGAAQVTVPSGVNQTSLLFEWSVSSPIGRERHCMVHAGPKSPMGPMIASGTGPSPLHIANATLPDGTSALTIMCVVAGKPVDAEVRGEIRANVSFWR